VIIGWVIWHNGGKTGNVFSLELNYGKKSDVQLVETIELFVGARVLQEREDSVV
jgi:hypothetical protein